MGSNTAIDLATNLDITLEQAIGYHLQGNHYPPVPLSMVQPCIEAIDAYYDEDYEFEYCECNPYNLIIEDKEIIYA